MACASAWINPGKSYKLNGMLNDIPKSAESLLRPLEKVTLIDLVGESRHPVPSEKDDEDDSANGISPKLYIFLPPKL